MSLGKTTVILKLLVNPGTCSGLERVKIFLSVT